MLSVLGGGQFPPRRGSRRVSALSMGLIGTICSLDMRNKQKHNPPTGDEGKDTGTVRDLDVIK